LIGIEKEKGKRNREVPESPFAKLKGYLPRGKAKIFGIAQVRKIQKTLDEGEKQDRNAQKGKRFSLKKKVDGGSGGEGWVPIQRLAIAPNDASGGAKKLMGRKTNGPGELKTQRKRGCPPGKKNEKKTDVCQPSQNLNVPQKRGTTG